MSNDSMKIILLKKLSPSNFIKASENIPIDETKSLYELYNDLKLTISSINFLPIGSIIIFSGKFIPKNWIKCDGSTILINDYYDLYNVIGLIYGGDNQSFNLPDLQGRNIIGVNNQYYLGKHGGEEFNVLSIDNLPSHNFTGTTNLAGNHNHNGLTNIGGDHTHKLDNNDYGLIHKSEGKNNTVNGLSLTSGSYLPDLLTKPNDLTLNLSGSHDHIINYDGNHSHTFITNTLGSGKPLNNLQPYVAMNYLIKFK